MTPQSRCFHEIDYGEHDVRPVLSLTDPTFRSVDPTRSRLGAGICSVTCSYPSVRDQNAPYAEDRAGDYLPVVDESGAVAIIDERNRKLLPTVGYLPQPRTLFGRASSKPRDLLDHDVAVIVKQPHNEYAGLITASVSRQGTLATVAVFNKDGRLIDEAPRRSEFSLAFLPVKYLTESLHPPVWTLASFFTAYSFDARATHQALFLMPNSFVALQRDRETGFIFQFLFALLFLLPALLFAGFLTWRVLRDATLMGLPWHARWLWGIGALAFGLPAYVTYRLTRPRGALALCANCGESRRVDQEACHHCGSGWNVPVLEPPVWRVISP